MLIEQGVPTILPSNGNGQITTPESGQDLPGVISSDLGGRDRLLDHTNRVFTLYTRSLAEGNGYDQKGAQEALDKLRKEYERFR